VPEMRDVMNATLSLKSGFAGNHLRVAIKNARCAWDVEEANKKTEFGAWFDDMMVYVPVAVVMAAAALEANANEILSAVLDGLIPLTESRKILMKDLNKDRSGSVMRKYRQLGLLLDKRPDAGSDAWLNADLLAQFRNRFMHFTPAWDHEKDIHDGEFVKQMKKRVPVSRFYEASFMFPYGFMTYASAKWAVNAALEFSEEYGALLGVKDRLAGSDTLP
jgi:hypothetical protein